MIELIASMFTSLILQGNQNYPKIMNDDFKIEIISSSKTSEKPESSKNNLSGSFKGDGYSGFSGYEDMTTFDPYIYSITSNVIDYSKIIPGEPISRSQNFSILGESLRSYTIQMLQNHPLSSTSKDIIFDTTCDNGTCVNGVSSEWINPLTYGFGIRCENVNSSICSDIFENKDTFTQIPSLSENEKPIVIAKRLGKKPVDSQNTSLNARSDSFRMIYKVNVSPTQSDQVYQNEIIYILVPQY